MARKFISVLDEISIISWSSDLLGKGKSMCLCRFRSMSGTDEWLQRSGSKMRRSSGRTQDVSFLPRSSWNRWRSNSSGIFPRIFVIGYSSRDPKSFGEKEHQTRRLQEPDHLHVNVQRHWFVKKKEWWELFLESRESQRMRWNSRKDTGRF